jgi:hypothetical protein
MRRGAGQYADVLEALHGAGLPAFFTQTGGMCAAIEVRLEAGRSLLITDADDTLAWQRREHQGWGVGMYEEIDDADLPLFYGEVSSGDIASLLVLVREVMGASTPDDTPSNPSRNVSGLGNPDRMTGRTQVREACLDQTAATARRDLCVAISSALARAGELLFISGSIIGGDRVAGISPLGYGDDAVVACGHAARTAASLCGGTTALLDMPNVYAANALVRQLIEVDYLVWCFAADPQAAAAWLRASSEERRRHWQPNQVRQRSGQHFCDVDYWRHCELGGHPTPEAATTLLQFSDETVACSWIDLVVHSVHIWDGFLGAAKLHGHLDAMVPIATGPEFDLHNRWQAWQTTDHVPRSYREARAQEASKGAKGS